MRKVFEKVVERLRGFLGQRDELALVIRCREAHATLLLQVVEMLEEEGTSQLFWKFPEPFASPEAYAKAVVNSFTAQQELVRQLMEKEGMAPWPPLPAALRDEAGPPVERLRQLMIFARSLLPAPEGTLVWVMLPSDIADRAAYARFVQQLVRHEFPFPWCHHMRILLRAEPTDAEFVKTLEQAPRLAWYEPELGPQALEAALEGEVADESLPLNERLQALLMTAGTDYSHKRYDSALEKYQLLYGHFAAQGNHVLAALGLNGMGEVHRATGNLAEASNCFEAAMVPASDGPSPSVPMMLNVSLNLANLRMEEKRWAEAEEYFDCVQKLATVLRSAPLKLQVLEQLGQAQYLQGKTAEAVRTWTAAATVAEELDQVAVQKELLERLRTHFAKARDVEQVRKLEEQLAGVAVPAE